MNNSYEDEVLLFNNLILRIAEKDESALEELFCFYGKLIFKIALKTSKSELIADEIVNEVMMKIWTKAKTIKHIESPKSWIYKITVNCVKDDIRRNKRWEKLDNLYSEDKSMLPLNNNEFMFLIEELNEIEKRIMILRFVEDLSFKNIADEINKPLSTVTSQYYRALQKIKNKLKK